MATVAFPPTYHEHNHDSNHDINDCIGIVPHDDMYLPLMGSLLPIPTTIFIPGSAYAAKKD
jgi:hypothetical protein